MKKLVTLVLAVCMLLSLLAGCGGNNKQSDNQGSAPDTQQSGENKPSNTPSNSTSDEKVTLKILAGQSTTDAGIEDFIDEAMAKKYPNVTLEWECVDWGNDFQPKMQQYMQSGLPDIMIGKAQDVQTYGNLGLLGDIPDEYVSRVLDAASANVKVNGKVQGLVFNALYQGVYYNRAMFKENGWEVPETQADLQKIIDDCKAKGITPFASHMVDTWSIGNVTMQFMMNDVFNNNATWGDEFRAGSKTFAADSAAQTAYQYNKLIFDNTYADTFSLEQTDCDARMVNGEAAMKVSGSWSIQNFLDIDESFDFGIFPFPNQTGDSKLIFEPNITVMTSAASDKQDAINCFLDVLTSDHDLAVQIYDFTKTASMLKDVTPTFENPSQSDIDKYAAADRVVDVTLGNNQLVWGGFQEENAKDIAAWLLGDESFEDCLAASDARVGTSSAS